LLGKSELGFGETMNSTDTKPKLIFLWTYTNWGGAQVYFLAVMKLAREEWDVVVALPHNSKPDLLGFLDQLGIRYEFLDWHFDPVDESTLLGKLRRQYARIRSEFATFNYLRRFDLGKSVLHIEVAPWQSWILLVALAVRRANVFATLHNFRPNVAYWRKLVWKFRLQIVSRLPRFHIFASNNDTKENLKGYVTPNFWVEIPVTYTCVDPEEIRLAKAAAFDRGSERSQLGIDPSAFVVLSVGQFIDRKGRWTLLEAAKSVSDVIFVWVMPEEPSDENRIRIASYDLGNRFVPVQSSSIGEDRLAILRFFRVADAFALPSFVEGLL
jgi:glycosyltransferase involved in cell wall biosynthesis